MAKFCTNCGAQLSDNMSFCVACGAKVRRAAPQEGPQPPQAPRPAPPEPARQAPAQAQRPAQAQPAQRPPQAQPAYGYRPVQTQPYAAQPVPPQPAPQPSAAVSQPPVRGKKAAKAEPGLWICAAFLCLGCLPYLLKSLLFLAVQASLGTVLCLILDLLGAAAAAGVLALGSKRITGTWNLPFALLLAFLLPALEAADLLLAANLDPLSVQANWISLGGIIGVRLLGAGLAVWALGALFAPWKGAKSGAKAGAWLCALAAFFAPDLVVKAWELSPWTDVTSFFSTFALKALAAFLEVCAFGAAARLLAGKRPAGPAKARNGLVPLAAGLALAALTVTVSLMDGARMNITERAKADVNGSLSDAELLLALGDMDGAVSCYETAAAHCEAWRTVATGEEYRVPEQFAGDATLEYLSYVNGDIDQLRRYLGRNFDQELTDVWAPLMIDRYGAKAAEEELSEYEQAHLSEMLRLCVAEECFVFEVPTAAEIREEGEALLEALVFPEAYQAKLEMASTIDRIQRGNMGIHEAVNQLLDMAEKYPEEMIFQYIAGTIGSENRWDGAGHYNRTADALERYRALWLEAYGKEASREELSQLDGALAGMMLNMQRYDRAIPLLENALAADPENLGLLQQLAFCYSSAKETEKGYELNKRLYAAAGDDVTVIWSYCVGALKHGENKEAIQAALRMADIVHTKLGGNLNHEDEILFNLVLYLALNDSGSWTDYQYRLYYDDTTDPELLPLFEQDEFFYNYVRAVYWEKQRSMPETALPYAQAALAAQEASGRLWYLNAIIYYDMGAFEDALRCYKQADLLEPDDPTILFGLANAYDALEDYQTAYNYCVRALAPYQSGTDHSYDNYGVSYHARALLNRLRPYVEVDD